MFVYYSFFVPILSPEITDEGQKLSPGTRNLSLNSFLRGDFLRGQNKTLETS